MKQSGFTLVELMIAVAIIAALLAIAMPVYQDYVIRTQVAAAYQEMLPGKTAIERLKPMRIEPTLTNGGGYIQVGDGTISGNGKFCKFALSKKTVNQKDTYTLRCSIGCSDPTKVSKADVNERIKGSVIELTREGPGTWTCKGTEGDSKIGLKTYLPTGCSVSNQLGKDC